MLTHTDVFTECGVAFGDGTAFEGFQIGMHPGDAEIILVRLPRGKN